MNNLSSQPSTQMSPKTLRYIGIVILAAGFIYHIVWTASSVQLNSNTLYDLIVFLCLTVSSSLLFWSYYLGKRSISYAFLRTLIIVVPVVVIAYISIFVIGLSAI